MAKAKAKLDQAERKRGPKPLDVAVATPKPGRPTPPPFIAKNKVAAEHWAELVEVLDAAGYLSVVDRTALAQLCHLYSQWRYAEEMIDKTNGPVITAPNGYRQVNPWRILATGYQKDMKPYLEMFGLNPRARSKLKLPEPPDPGDAKWSDFDDTGS